jgi:hypothetical protein
MSDMIQELEYRFIEPADKRNRALLEVDVPRELFDATYAKGRMRYELSLPWNQTVIGRRINPDGGLTLGFLYSGMVGDWQYRLGNILTVIGELDTAAAAKGMSDLRIGITEPLPEYPGGTFGFSFELPDGDEVAVLDKLNAGMVRAATFLQGHIPREEASQSVSVTHDSESGYALHTHGPRTSSNLVQQSMPSERWIQVSSENRLDSAPGFAVTLIGVIAALDSIRR